MRVQREASCDDCQNYGDHPCPEQFILDAVPANSLRYVVNDRGRPDIEEGIRGGHDRGEEASENYARQKWVGENREEYRGSIVGQRKR